MSLEKAKTHLAKYGKEDDIQLFDVSSATVELAALALNCKPERIAHQQYNRASRRTCVYWQVAQFANADTCPLQSVHA